MTIVITDAKEQLKMTQSEYDRLLTEYQNAFSNYFGTPPSFEDWVRNKFMPPQFTESTAKESYTRKGNL